MFSVGGHSPFQRTNIAIFLHNAKETHTFLLTAAIFLTQGTVAIAISPNIILPLRSIAMHIPCNHARSPAAPYPISKNLTGHLITTLPWQEEVTERNFFT